MFGSLLDLAKNTVRVVAAPIDAVASVLNDGVEAVAEVVEDLAEDVKSITK